MKGQPLVVPAYNVGQEVVLLGKKYKLIGVGIEWKALVNLEGRQFSPQDTASPFIWYTLSDYSKISEYEITLILGQGYAKYRPPLSLNFLADLEVTVEVKPQFTVGAQTKVRHRKHLGKLCTIKEVRLFVSVLTDIYGNITKHGSTFGGEYLVAIHGAHEMWLKFDQVGLRDAIGQGMKNPPRR